MSFIEKGKLVSTGRKLEIINGMSFERKPNCIQIEYGYVIASRRRKKIFNTFPYDTKVLMNIELEDKREYLEQYNEQIIFRLIDFPRNIF